MLQAEAVEGDAEEVAGTSRRLQKSGSRPVLMTCQGHHHHRVSGMSMATMMMMPPTATLLTPTCRWR